MARRILWVMVVVQCGLLTTQSVRAEETMPSFDALAVPVSSAAKDVMEKPADAVEEPAEGQSGRVSMEFQGAKLSDVLKTFSKQAGLNIITDASVASRQITIYLEDVLPLDALNQILASGNMTYERPVGSDIYIVKPKSPQAAGPKTITRVYRLRYARVSDSIFSRSAAALNAITTVEAKAAQLAEKPPLPTLEKAGMGIDLAIKKLLTEQGSLVTDPRTNTLIITDAPENFPKIEAALAALDVRAAQVMVDAELIETTVTKLKDLGVEWGTGSEGDLVNFTMGSRSTRFPFGFFGEDVAPTVAAGDSLNLSTSTLSFTNATAVLQALESDGDSKVLARPKVLTMDNESALIRLTTEETIGFQTTTGENSGTTQSQPERVTTGIMLGVTPQVNDGGFITMTVEPSLTKTVAAKIIPPSGQGTTRDTKTRGAHTVVRIRSGDTLVLGGLIDRAEDHSLRKVPILSGIPVLGEAFKNDELSNSASELIVFVTPRILGDPTENQVASTSQPMTAREQEPGPASRQDLIEQTLNRLEQPSL